MASKRYRVGTKERKKIKPVIAACDYRLEWCFSCKTWEPLFGSESKLYPQSGYNASVSEICVDVRIHGACVHHAAHLEDRHDGVGGRGT